MFSLIFYFSSESKPIKATKRARWSKSDFALSDDEAEERNFAEVQMSEDEADRCQEIPDSDSSDHSISSEDYED